MKPIQRLQKMFSRKAFDPVANLDLSKIGWHKMGGSSTYTEWKRNDYENAYPAISKVANAVMMVEQYTINDKAKSVPSNILDVTYSPNEDMSAVDFREALTIMCYVHPKVHLRVHHDGEVNKSGKIPVDSITGFTFIENAVQVVRDGKKYYHLPNGKIFPATEVMTLKSINPNDLSEGFSPTMSARKWIALDDYIAMFQQGFFQNGAVPSGQFIITAQTVTEFNDIVDNLEQTHKGSGRNNNVSYVHRPTDAQGKAQPAQIEWVPFNQSNKEMSLQALFDQANQKIDRALGVPKSIMAMNDNNTYASVRVDEVIMAKYVVSPFMMKLWSKFNHELNRITGGMGVSFTYDLDIPQMADEEKVKAEARSVEVQTITHLENQGYDLKNIVTALELDELYLKLGKRVVPEPVVVEPEVEQAGTNDTIDESGSEDDVTDAQKVITPTARERYENLLRGVVMAQRMKQIQIVIDAVDNLGKSASKSKALYGLDDGLFDVSASVVNQFAGTMYSVIEPVINVEGSAQRVAGMKLLTEAGVKANVAQFKISDKQKKDYQKYVKKVGTSYTNTTADGIRTVLQQANEAGLNAGQMRGMLQEFALKDYEVDRLVITEINRAGSEASIYAMENISEELGVKIYKVWNNGSDPCEFCQAMNGERTLVEETFIPVGGQVTSGDKIFTNEFVDIDDTTMHPHCHCYPTYEVEYENN